ncbi:hypothetical protein D3C85_344030 [compost metagenome]
MTKHGVREVVFHELEEELTLYPTLLPICKEEFESFLAEARIPIRNPQVRIRLPEQPSGHQMSWAVELEVMGDIFIFKARRVPFSADKLRGE